LYVKSIKKKGVKGAGKKGGFGQQKKSMGGKAHPTLPTGVSKAQGTKNKNVFPWEGPEKSYQKKKKDPKWGKSYGFSRKRKRINPGKLTITQIAKSDVNGASGKGGVVTKEGPDGTQSGRCQTQDGPAKKKTESTAARKTKRARKKGLAGDKGKEIKVTGCGRRRDL